MKKVLTIAFLFFPPCLPAQDSIAKEVAWSFSGYVKDLVSVRFDQHLKHPAATNLFHNRVNVGWSAKGRWSGRIELRNRLYWGDHVRSAPGFRQQLRNTGEAVNLSVGLFESRSAILQTNVERLWLAYKQPQWNLRAGRQRINWGITNTWNPNDLFNTYNFLDFDYEERPGSDAVKVEFLTSGLSGIEMAAAGTGGRPIAAARYFTNYREYDLQGIAGLYRNRFTAGMGWAGRISDAGFKGEVQYYAGRNDSASQWLVVLEGDYIFKNGWYLSAAFLYNQKGLFRPLEGWTKLVFQASPRQLMPSKWNALVQASKEFTPLFSGSMNVVYAPGPDLLILFPSLRYNLHTNWDLDLVWQSFFAETTRWEPLTHSGFFRLKWSF